MKQALRDITFNLWIVVAVYKGQTLAPVYTSGIVTIDTIGSEIPGWEICARKCAEAHRPGLPWLDI